MEAAGNRSPVVAGARRTGGGVFTAGLGRGRRYVASAALLVLLAGAAPTAGQTAGGPAEFAGPVQQGPANGPVYIPDVSHFLPEATSRESLSKTMQVFVLLTLLTVAPSLFLMMTCFVRMTIVLALLRQALGTHQLPPAQVMVGLALFLTFLVMAPTWERIQANALDPYLAGQMGQLDAIRVASHELRGFMFAQIEAGENEEDVYMMYEYAAQRAVGEEEELRKGDVPMSALIPAFMLSELKTSFVIGFRIFLPFLVIDMVIATVLVSMGMMMLPPVLISLPFKLLLFVLADGWHLIVGSLMASVY